MSPNPASILDSVKKVLGLESDYTEFDLDVIMHINSGLAVLRSLNCGPDAGLTIEDSTTLWTDFESVPFLINQIKSFLYLYTQSLFDPSADRYSISSKQALVEEMKWRILSTAEEINPPQMPILIPPDPFCEWRDPVTRAIYVPVVVQLTSGASVGINAKMGNVFDLDLAQNTIISKPFNGINGQHITMRLKSNGFGVTWAAGWNFGSAGLPELSGSGVTDIISAVYSESTTQWDAGFSPGF